MSLMRPQSKNLLLDCGCNDSAGGQLRNNVMPRRQLDPF